MLSSSMVESSPTDSPPSMAEGDTVIEDKFGPPHAQIVSQSLQLWILVPGILALVAFIGKAMRVLAYNHIVGVASLAGPWGVDLFLAFFG